MQVQALKDQFIYGRPVKAGQVLQIGKRHAEKLIREGLVKPHEPLEKQIETKEMPPWN